MIQHSNIRVATRTTENGESNAIKFVNPHAVRPTNRMSSLHQISRRTSTFKKEKKIVTNYYSRKERQDKNSMWYVYINTSV